MKKLNSFQKKISIERKIFTPMMTFIVCQTFIFIATIFLANTLQHLTQGAYSLFSQTVEARKAVLENMMIQRWSNYDIFLSPVNTINKEYTSYVKDESIDKKEYFKVNETVTNSIYRLLRNSFATEAFVIFDDKVEGSGNSCIYLRDLEPSKISINDADILVEAGPSSIVKKFRYTMDTNWSNNMNIDENDKRFDFYFKPFNAAKMYHDVNPKDLGYWSKPFRLYDNDLEVITYSIPLIDFKGEPFGVIGVGIELGYLNTFLPYSELSETKKGTYILAVGDIKDGNFLSVTKTGPLYKNLVNSDNKFKLKSKSIFKNIYEPADHRFLWDISAAVSNLELYNTNTPFENDKWSLIGIMDKEELLKYSLSLKNSLMITFIISLVFGLIGTLFTSKLFAAPIMGLVEYLRQSNASMSISLPKVNITEIDELAEAIEKLSADVARSASKISYIVNASGIALGAIEYNIDEKVIFLTDNMSSIMDIDFGYTSLNLMPYEKFMQKVQPFKRICKLYEGNINSNEFSLEVNRNGEKQWLKFTIKKEENKILVVVLDITEQINEKHKIEYERDYDMLTQLLNRRAFERHMMEVMSKYKKGILIMWDLDNLKYINDNFGHDFGDKYISSAARVFDELSSQNAYVSRMSGDEFLAYIYEYDNKNDIISIIKNIHNKLSNTEFILEDNKKVMIKASCGIAWRNCNDTYETLLKKADSAMYEIKSTIKGGIKISKDLD